MTEERDPYVVLGVEPGSRAAAIEAAHDALAQRYSSDRSINAAKKLAEVERAYQVLGDPKSRSDYDQKRGYAAPIPSQPSPQLAQVVTAAAASTAQQSSKRGVHPIMWAIGGLVAFGIVATASAPNDQVANNIIDVDENMTTTDMSPTANADAALNATEDVSDGNSATNEAPGTADENLAEAEQGPPDLSGQFQLPVAFESVESASDWASNVLRTSGFEGARTASEQCHSSVHDNPSWAGVDRCAAFDYAAAYLDDILVRSRGGPAHAYFQFSRDNQSDQYTINGAPLYSVSNRLITIRRTVEAALRESGAADAAKARSVAPVAPQPQANLGMTVPTTTAPPRPRVVPEGVFLNSETDLKNGTKRCRFNNGYERIVPTGANCFLP